MAAAWTAFAVDCGSAKRPLLDCQPSVQEGSSPELAFLEFILKLHHSNSDLMRRLRDAFERQNL